MNKTAAVWCLIIGLTGMSYQSKSNINRGNHYLVKFTGIEGASLEGQAGWVSNNKANQLIHMNKKNGVLPMMADLSPPPGAVVMATGIADEDNELIIKIYRDGIECSEEVVSGKAMTIATVCRQE